MGDAGQDGLGQGSRVAHQVAGESGDASGQGLLLVAGALVGAAEQPVQQLGVRAEEPGVELGVISPIREPTSGRVASMTGKDLSESIADS